MRVTFTQLTLQVLLVSASSLPPTSQRQESSLGKRDTFAWSVIGDSWASGVAYNLSNVYGPTDGKFCYRTKEAWGSQMRDDFSWIASGLQAFYFGACGGTLMNDLKGQMSRDPNHSSLIWGMFGGNNAYFGAIARACIYQPYTPEHPFGWGPPWDEDTDGTGLCKQNIKKAEDYLSNPNFMRKELTDALNDILSVAQNNLTSNGPLDFYLSSYVRFFDETTDDCDKWSFAHDKLSAGHPKVVKDLRKIINNLSLEVNNLQSDVIKNYKIPSPNLPNVRVHNSQPDSIFDGHRFCEKGATFEDQYYGKDLWLWNLQYYDESSGEEVAVAMTDKDGTKFMTSPVGVNVTQGFQTVLGADTNPDAIIPQGDDANTQQYGFGWTARPFHPKFDGHKALKDFFIKQMRDDKVPGVKLAESPANASSPSPASTSPAPPAAAPTLACNGINNVNWMTRDAIASKGSVFCADAAKQGVQDHGSGSIVRSYDTGTVNDLDLSMDWPLGAVFRPSEPDCNEYIRQIMDNWKHGGSIQVGEVKYNVTPKPQRYIPGICSMHVHEYETWDGIGDQRKHKFQVTVDAKDGSGNALSGSGGDQWASDSDPYVMPGYYDSLIFVPESQGGDYIQFQLGAQHWTTKDPSNTAKCDVGDWNKDTRPIHRDMDCTFQC
ncbi:hypothetical protein LARI1_G003428 [Lachnellula arida]|uniref:SGNH hydrolase-type esterase domain-containing protein n=1 Tax=Lachnellula arida TaxID=1316785 RepID=A0A8T9BG92_9HELO|nr:hypothetical protein LARI1_G003428 [Lachnellula arida]